ncbi:hypothetical protein LSUE1_G002441 [Lachnellula suecica]|uniref:Uncharacterized protein n=1 Tax=Lachnellula suecica TaxID=602035 RepID=A0A8T9C9Z1_9HELO|nr:hypothetical protein LSUE1_G002441 [Lachnellula suecica]
MTEVTKAFTSVTGVEVEYQELDDDEYWSDKGAMKQNSSLTTFFRDYDALGIGAREDLEEWLKLMHEKPDTLENWLKRSGPWFQD